MPNPFYVEPASLQGLGSMVKSYREGEQAEEAKIAGQVKQQEMQDVLEAGDIAQMSQFMAANPQMAKGLEASFKFKDDATRQNMADSAFRILQGEDQDTVIRDRAAFISQQGGSPAETLQSLDDSEGETIKNAKIMLAQYGTPEQIKAVQDIDAANKKKFAQGTGDMAGYAFDPSTGDFQINPEIKQALEAKATAKAVEGIKLNAKDRQGINKDVTGLIGDAVSINKTAKDLAKLGKIGGGPASIALVFKFMKALDPQSVVREGEFLTAERSAGLPESMRNMYNKIMEGEKLGAVQIKQFIDTANEIANSAVDSSTGEISSYLDTYEDTIPESFKSSLMNRIPKRIGGVKTEKPKQDGAPEKGVVVDGYTFLGGDASDQANWSKA